MSKTGELVRWKHVASRGGLTTFIVSDIINGRRRIILEDVPRLAKGVNVREAWLVFEEGPMRPDEDAIPELPGVPVVEYVVTAEKRRRRHGSK
jgi:hypothetical protein